MFARVTVVQTKSGKMDECIKLYRDGVVPAAKSQKGYKGAYLLVDGKTDKGISITVWDREEDAIANEQSGYYQEQLAKFKDVFAGAPVREGYEIVVADEA
jgi:heme-degrading monooxygenase HmoA